MDNRFVDSLYTEFVDNLWEVLGFGIEGLKKLSTFRHVRKIAGQMSTRN
jgi:hypothetical protein